MFLCTDLLRGCKYMYTMRWRSRVKLTRWNNFAKTIITKKDCKSGKWGGNHGHKITLGGAISQTKHYTAQVVVESKSTKFLTWTNHLLSDRTEMGVWCEWGKTRCVPNFIVHQWPTWWKLTGDPHASSYHIHACFV